MEKLMLEQIRNLRGKAYNVAVQKLDEIEKNEKLHIPSDLDEDTIRELKYLVSQFYYGLSAQDDLLELCIRLEWIKL